MIINMPYALLTSFLSISAGLFISVAIGGLAGEGGKSALPKLSASILLSVIALLYFVLHLGNPDRVFNLLAHITSGLSMTIISGSLLTIVATICLFSKKKNSKILNVVSIFIVLCLMFGLSKLFLKPSRPALNIISSPLFILSFVFMMMVFLGDLFDKFFGEINSNRISLLKFISLVFQAIVILIFAINTLMIGDSDRYIKASDIFHGKVSVMFFLSVIILGLIIPFLLELYQYKKSLHSKTISTIISILLIIGMIAFTMILNLSALYTRPMII